MSLRIKRLESIFLKEISDIVQNDLKDPKIGFITISDVRITNDLSYAKVYVSFLGKEERNDAGLKALNRAKGYIRSELAKRVSTHKVPELTFQIDDTLKKAQRIENILDNIKNN